MDNKIFNRLMKVAGALALPMGLALTSCVAEPDDDNLYTFTGQTIEDFLSANEEFDNFNYILQRSGYDRLLSTYGTYTCFAPTNEAVITYIDSLYNDPENVDLPHNGMTENSLEGLTDSLCTDIAEYHLARTEIALMSIENGTTINTFLGRVITASVPTGTSTMYLNNVATITNGDNETINGIVHVIDNVLPRSNRPAGRELTVSGNFSLFAAALELTGLYDLLNASPYKNKTFSTPSNTIGYTQSGGIATYYFPNRYEGRIGYTIFAVPDSILKSAYGIETLDDLIAYANAAYESSAKGSVSTQSSGWYDYYRNNGAQVSTGTDYTDSLNTLNMFMRYHIIKGAVKSDMLTVRYMLNEPNSECYDYYETLLPKTILKIWEIDGTGATYINRWKENNTLTDDYTNYGSNAMHPIRRVGSRLIDRSNPMAPINGYIYSIDSPLVYDYYVPNGVLNERMRFEATTLLPELASDGFRGMDQITAQALANNSSVVRMRFPSDYFDNVVTFNGSNTTLDMNFRAGTGGHDFILYQGDSFQGMGEYDLAIKLPPVPDRAYELRLDVTLGGSYFGMMQFYIGDGPDISDFSPIDIPIDFRMDATDPRIGLADASGTALNPQEEDDNGLSTDQAMHTRGWMRAPGCYTRPDDSRNARIANYSVRRVLLTQDFQQRDYWLRIKAVLPDEHKYQLDYIEFCPVDISQNQQYLEDIY